MCIKAREEEGERTTGAAEASAIRAVKGRMYFMLLRRVLVYYILFDERKERNKDKKASVCR